MKQIIKNYSFNAAAHTITFSDFSSIDLERVLLITNVTTNEVIYIFNTPSRGGTATGNVLTLEYNTSSMSNGDKLQITYDCADNDPTYGVPATRGKYTSSAPTLSNNDHGELQLDSNANLKATLATSLNADIDSLTVYPKAYVYTKKTATGPVSATPTAIAGYYVAASASGVISIYDNASTAAGDTMLATSKAVAAGDYITLPVPIQMQNGIYFSLNSGTATVYILTQRITAQ